MPLRLTPSTIWLKPIDARRLAKVLKKAEDSHNENATTAPTDNAEVLNENSKVFVKDRDNCWFVRVGDIKILESIGNYTKIYFDTHQPMIKRSLSYLEERLPENKFIRAKSQNHY